MKNDLNTPCGYVAGKYNVPNKFWRILIKYTQFQTKFLPNFLRKFFYQKYKYFEIVKILFTIFENFYLP